MQIQDLKWWVWVMIGLVVGLGLSYSYANWDHSLEYRAGTDSDFQRDLLARRRVSEKQLPVIAGIRLHPTVDPDSTRVTYQRLNVQSGQANYQMQELITRKPYLVESSNKSGFGRRNAAPDVRAYLEGVQAANPNSGLVFSHAFWEEKGWTYVIVTTVSTVIIGGAWPLLLRVLIGAGLAKPPRRTKKIQKNRLTTDRTRPNDSTPSTKQADDLAAVTASYENRAESAIDEDQQIAGAIAMAENSKNTPEIRELAGAPVTSESPVKPREEENKQYEGEFYPVARASAPSGDDGKDRSIPTQPD